MRALGYFFSGILLHPRLWFGWALPACLLRHFTSPGLCPWLGLSLAIETRPGERAAGQDFNRSSKNEIFRRVELFGWEKEQNPFSSSSNWNSMPPSTLVLPPKILHDLNLRGLAKAKESWSKIVRTCFPVQKRETVWHGARMPVVGSYCKQTVTENSCHTPTFFTHDFQKLFVLLVVIFTRHNGTTISLLGRSANWAKMMTNSVICRKLMVQHR